VIGNAPWGEELLTAEAKEWASEKTRQWPVCKQGNRYSILPKAAALTKQGGRVSMIQSESSLLFTVVARHATSERILHDFPSRGGRQSFRASIKVFNQKTRSTQKSVATIVYRYFCSQGRFQTATSVTSVQSWPRILPRIRCPNRANGPSSKCTSLMHRPTLIFGAHSCGETIRDWIVVRRLRSESSRLAWRKENVSSPRKDYSGKESQATEGVHMATSPNQFLVGGHISRWIRW